MTPAEIQKERREENIRRLMDVPDLFLSGESGLARKYGVNDSTISVARERYHTRWRAELLRAWR